MADVIFDLVNSLPQRPDFFYVDPNDLVSIKTQRKNSGQINPPDKTQIADKMKGGWYGRICGCLLGKPIEGIYLADLEKILKRTDNYPLSRYVTLEDAEKIDAGDIGFPIKHRAFYENLGKMPTDDDMNYMLIAYEILKRYGRDFTSDNLSDVWLTTQTYTAYCSAEYIAYINMIGGYTPPVSCEYKNVYREWIGSQIQGDVWGYINPGKPKIAAKMAWRDARVSRVKKRYLRGNVGVCNDRGGMRTRNVKEIIGAGLGEIPHNSRLHEAISKIVADYENGVSAEKCFSDIRSKWDERQSYDWCHVISSTEIVAAALLYGNGDYEKSVCLAVSQAFDTDCNGATVGLVLGVALGHNELPKKWTKQINNTMAGTVEGYKEVSVSEMAEKILKFVE